MMTTAEFKTTLGLSRKAYARAKADREAEEASWAEDGFRNHYCIHGTNQWTDYDNICGGCENGDTLLSMVVRGVFNDVRDFSDRLDWMSKAPGYLPGDTSNTLWAWVAEPLNRPEYR